jgi:hypothetical protein
MHFVGRGIRIGLATALVLGGLAGGVQGFALGGGGVGFGGSFRNVVQLRGKVVCVRCGLAEAQQVQPQQHQLYELLHSQGQVVFEVSTVIGSWDAPYPPRLTIRARNDVFRQLTENLHKEVEMIGLLNNQRTLDIFWVNSPASTATH